MDSIGLIVGLGNPGPDYENTRHNYGFLLVDALLRQAEGRKSSHLEVLQQGGEFQLWRLNLGGASCLVAKPLTYMNLSGKAVARICGRHGVESGSILVAHDELDLPVGRMKLKRGGGSNGHKGIDSIVEHLGGGDFLRLRLGIGRPEHSSQVVRWVLEPFAPEEAEGLAATCEAALKCLNLLARRGLAEATQCANSFAWAPPAPPAERMDTSV